MSLILSGTDGLSDVDGTAATPAIRGTDTNTGIFFPAADTVATSVGGTEGTRLTSTGLGIGTSSPAAKLHLSVASAAVDGTKGVRITNPAGTVAVFECGSIGDSFIGTTSGSDFNIRTGNAIVATFLNSGNVGIGTTSPAYKLDVVSTSMRIASGTTGVGYVQYGNSATATNNWHVGTEGDGTYRFYNSNFGSGVERARITSDGNLLVGTTSNVAVPARTAIVGDASFGGLAVEASGSGSGYPVWFRDTDATSASQQMVHFRRGASNVGYITTTNTTTTYSSASDYRLKEDITPMTGALAKVALFKPCTYKWKIDGSVGEGFIAHELQEVCPIAVHGTKDGIDADGKPDYQAIDTSFLVATLTAAIQEQQALITQLTTRITALETP